VFLVSFKFALFFFIDKTIKLWRVTEKEWKVEGFNLKEENGTYRDPANLTQLSVPKVTPTNLMVEASLRRYAI
jgi:serine/threonine-protein phosphatase 2A regulatory subunit B